MASTMNVSTFGQRYEDFDRFRQVFPLINIYS